MPSIIKKLVFFLSVFCITGWWGPFAFLDMLFGNNVDTPPGTQAWLNQEVSSITSQASNLDVNVLKLGLKAYLKARQEGLDAKQLLTIIDYSKPSTERRLFVVDLKKAKVLYNTWVSHGKNSGEIETRSFSNSPGSLKTSLGVFLTGEPYEGGNGYSLHLTGLEPGFNDKAYSRSIVMHGAWYVGPGQRGRSWGCPAVSTSLAKPIIDTIKDRTLIFAYGRDPNYLRKSTFLTG
ncbi:hypothetical protein AYO45_06800 [Gammaproteobacteria bacterium SCGC AG-212-F23]|nr:hypothetical protein AYO45_06800 [Gammaproteobacteria bacterium SCGC AG-212-F23]